MDLIAVALAPGLAIVLFIFYRDKFDREPPVVLLASFFFGILSTVPAYLLESTAGYFKLPGIEGSILFAFFGVALVEELVKFVPLRYYALSRQSFDEPLDGIVHGVMIGMGFATLENILYVYRHGMETGLLRMFTAVPGHASWGVIMGYYAGKARFDHKRKGRILLTGFMLATFFHGLYDACLFMTQHVEKNIAFLLATAAFTTHVVAIMLASRLIRQHSDISKGLFHQAPVLTVRHANITDVPLIMTLAKQIWPQTYQQILSPQQIRYMMNMIYSEKALKNQMQDGHQFMIVYNASIPVGFASFSEIEPTVFKLQKIYLLPNQQGRGTGRFTIEQVIEEIKPRGATALRLNVNKHNKAKSFYERLGFTVISDVKIDIGNGYVMDDYVMEKKLVSPEQAYSLNDLPS